jgi:putative spermidine/putrescine transport system permease protein
MSTTTISPARRSRPPVADVAVWAGASAAVVFLVLPTVFAVLSAFGSNRFPTFPPSGWTLGWFSKVDVVFIHAAQRSLTLAVATTAVCLVIGVPAGLALARWGRGSTLAAAFYRSPLQVPYVVIGVATLQAYVLLARTTGLELLGTVAGLTIALTVIALPYMVGAVAAAAAGLSQDLESAAHGLGASPVRTFFLITLPALRPAVIAGSVFTMLIAFDDIPVTLFLVGSGPKTLPVQLFFTAEFSLTPQLFAVSALVTAITTVVLLVVNRVFGLNKIVGV